MLVFPPVLPSVLVSRVKYFTLLSELKCASVPALRLSLVVFCLLNFLAVLK